MLVCAIISRANFIVILPMETFISSFQRTVVVFASIIFIIKARFLPKRYSIPTILSSQSSMRKRDAIISHGRALSIWLIGIVLKDRKVAFNDLNDENDEELGLDIEEPAQGKIDEKELLKEAV